MRKPKIFIACDTQNISKVKKIFRSTKTNSLDINYKFGLEFFYSKNGRNFISKLKKKNIFLDLKLNDIPNTSVAALKSVKDLKCVKYISVHINSGFEAIKAVKKVSGKIKILGVTVLTSLNSKNLNNLGFSDNLKKIVLKQAKIAKKAKLDGIICSSEESKLLKKICKKMEIITPGIRLSGDKNKDQKRINTPKKAFYNGATAIVIGRSITQGSISKNFKRLNKSLS